MTKRKIILLSILFIGLLAISAVSASDNATDTIVGADDSSNDVANVVDVSDDVVGEMAVDIDSEKENNDIKLNDSSSNTDDSKGNGEVLNSAEENETLSYNLDDDVLSASPPYYSYSLSVSDTTIEYGSGGNIVISVNPTSGYSYRYNFYLQVIDSNGIFKISKNYYDVSSDTEITHEIGSNQLSVGTYTIKLINYADGHVMDTAVLKVLLPLTRSDYSVSVSDTLMNYGSSGSISMSILPASSSYVYRYDFYLRVYDSSGSLKINNRYYSNSSAYSETYIVPSTKLSPGNYTVRIVNNYDHAFMDTANLVVNSVLPSSAYSVSVSDTLMNYGSSGSISMNITPASSGYAYKYDFYLTVYDSNNVEKICIRYYSTSSAYSKTYNVPSTKLSLGTYSIKIINKYDNMVMSTANLVVNSVLPSSAYSVNVFDAAFYKGYNGNVTVGISPASYDYVYKYDFYLKVYDSGKEMISQRCNGANPVYSRICTVDSAELSPGTYAIKIINAYDNNVMDTATLTVKELTLETQNAVKEYKDTIQYKVRVSEGVYKSGLKVTFICNGIEKKVNTDSNGYATLNIHLKSGTYYITTQYGNAIEKNTIKVNPTYVANKYKLVYIKPVKTYYGAKSNFKYGWEGNLKGFFKIYKGKKVVYSQKLDTSGKVGDYFKYKSYTKFYSIKKLPVGTYFAKIIDSTGKIAKKQTIKIYKSQTRILCASFRTTVGSNAGINVKVYGKANDNAVGFVKFKINGKLYSAKLKSGSAKIKVQFPFNEKTYHCSVKYIGNKYYKPSSKLFNVGIVKPKTQTYIDSFKTTTGSQKTVEVHVNNKFTKEGAKGGTVKLSVAGDTYYAKVYSGVAKVTVNAPSEAGTYYGHVEYLGTKYIYGSSDNFEMNVQKPVYTAMLYFNVDSTYYSETRLKTGDVLLASANSYDRQSAKGIYIGTRIDVGQERQDSTRVIKAKLWFYNDYTGKEITKVQSADNNGYDIKKVDWIDGYTPYKVQVWYCQR